MTFQKRVTKFDESASGFLICINSLDFKSQLQRNSTVVYYFILFYLNLVELINSVTL